jgi:hypothetical protein
MIGLAEIESFAREIWQSQENQIDLLEWVEKRLEKHSPQLNDLQINDLLDDIVASVKTRLLKRIRRCKEAGQIPTYEFSQTLPDLIIRSIDLSPTEINQTRSKVSSMERTEFQELCLRTLELNGLQSIEVIGDTTKGGIIFCGLLRMDKYSSGALLKGLQIRVIGQIKHHIKSTKVGVTEIRSLSRAYSYIRNGVGHAVEPLPSWFTALKCPILPMFITNTTLTSSAYTIAEQHGILIGNGDQIAEDLSYPPKFLK